jgi:hypothetical protein
MATDITTQLIQNVTSQLSDTDQTVLQDTADLYNNVDTALSTSADLAQLLGLLLTSTGGYGGIVALGAVLIFGIITAIAESTQSGADASDVLQELYTTINDIQNEATGIAWSTSMNEIVTFLTPLYTDIDTIAHEPWTDPNVSSQTVQFHTDALNFVNDMALDQAVWLRPFVQSLSFIPQTLAIASELNGVQPVGAPWSMGWFGNLPQTPTSDENGSIQVFDPQYTLPAWLYGLGSYIAILAVLNQIDPSQPTLTQFIADYQQDLISYAKLLQSQYATGVAGLVKTDVPTVNDVMSYLYYYFNVRDESYYYLSPGSTVQNSVELVSNLGPAGVLTPQGPSPPRIGFSWNGVYGVVDVYGVFVQTVADVVNAPRLTVAIPSRTSCCMVDVIKSDGMNLTWKWTVPDSYSSASGYGVNFLMYPWIRARVTLGLMARWKAIYIMRGYEHAWSVLESLLRLSGQGPANRIILPDGTAASPDWSVRELYGVLNSFTQDTAIQIPPYAPPGQLPSYISVLGLVTAFDMIANGNWGGPAREAAPVGYYPPPSSVSLCQHLAAACR